MIELSNNLHVNTATGAGTCHTVSRARAAGGRAAAVLAVLGAAALLPLVTQSAQAAQAPASASPAAARPPRDVPALHAARTAAQHAAHTAARTAVRLDHEAEDGTGTGTGSGGTPAAAQSVTRQPLVWDRLAMCESSGDWHVNTGNSFYGGLQFWQPTWERFGGLKYAARADLATPQKQITVAEDVLRVQGWKAWPVCSRRLGLVGLVGLVGHAHHGHTVKAGETLSAIADAYGVEGGWPTLYRSNKAAVGDDPDNLAVGTVLTLS